MTLADERLKEPDNLSITENERILLRCRVAADLIHKGQHETARETLGELWSGVGEKPDVKGLPPILAAAPFRALRGRDAERARTQSTSCAAP